MLTEDQDIFELFDEFYFIAEAPPVQRVKEKEILKKNTNEFKFIGANKKNAILVYHQPENLSGNDLTMVENLITRAIGWSMNDIALINLAENAHASFQDIKIFFKPVQVIFWGCDAFLDNNQLPKKWHEVLKGKELKLLAVYPVSFYHDKTDAKKQLWDAIQQLLELK